MTRESTQEPLRPRDLAILQLAARDLLPRRRARDQQADLIGLDLKRHVLERIAALDPEPAGLEAALLAIVHELGTPSGPARAVAMSVREEWQAACLTPNWMAHLLAEAVDENAD